MLNIKKTEFVVFCAASGMGACSAVKVVEVDEDSCCAVDDRVPPELSCLEAADGQSLGQDVPLQCTVTDDQGVLVVTSFFRLETNTYWDDELMREVHFELDELEPGFY